ncbi:MAG: hypothetical protein ACTHJJ_10790 [Intrasporangium sp.]|uniref:hypothetical protein n=1 Tax=Intrasporangium sp. TaxID=1925024 RepID=UPI003F7F6729
MATSIVRGLIAGAVGTTALNAATYLDMVLRGRPSSSTPEQTVERTAELLGVSVPGSEEQRQARKSGLAPLLGIATGVGAGMVLGALRGAGWARGPAATLAVSGALAMTAGNGPMALLGVTDPRKWPASSWVADIVPHAVYAVAATATLEAFDR